MKILHLIKTSEGATWAIRLLELLKTKHPEVSFSVLLPKGGKHFIEYQTVCDNVIEFDFLIDSKIIQRGRKLKTYVDNIQPDIIHSWFTQTTLYARIFLRYNNIPRLFQVVGPAHLEHNLFKTADIKSAQKNDYWIATSKYIYDKYINCGIDKNRVFLNYAFIDIEKLLYSKKLKKPINYIEKFGLEKNTKIIGTASYIYPPKFYENRGIKGHEYLLEAFELLLKQRDDVVLIIAGGSFGNNMSYEHSLKTRANNISKDKIYFTGKYESIYETISNFDVFVYLSKSENLGGVYESLLFEIPTISSNKGALPELVINDKTGYNIDPSYKEDLVDKINSVLNSDHNNFKSEGKALVKKTFNKKTITDKAYQIYESLI
jgi:glycosyltransferase involved in cell wall biosynthesis